MIEAQAKRRLADEYDAAQERGEVATDGRPESVSGENGFRPATAADLGLNRNAIYDARVIRLTRGHVVYTVQHAMSPKQQTNIRLDPTQIEGLRRIRVRIGIPASEQIRRAIDAWLAAHNRPEPRPVRTRAQASRRPRSTRTEER